MDSIEYLGLVASSLATLAFLPQVVKTWRTGSAHDFSLTTLLMIEAGTSIWIYYGVLVAGWRWRCWLRDAAKRAFLVWVPRRRR